MLIVIATRHEDNSDRSIVAKADTDDQACAAMAMFKAFGYRTVEITVARPGRMDRRVAATGSVR